MKVVASGGRWLVAALLFGMASAFAQQIGVYGGGSIEQGSSRQLTAYVPLVDPAIRWTVNDVEGGNATVGTISRLGLYVAPAAIPSPNEVTIKAVSVSEPAKYGSTRMAITQPQVQLWSLYPASVPVGAYALRLNGSNFGASSVAYVNGAAVPTTVDSATSIRITGTATAAQIGGSLPVKVVNTGLGSTTSGVVRLAVTAAPPVSVALSPASGSVLAGGNLQFSATVANTANTAVGWSVNGVSGGNASVGTISSSGLYTAPATVPNPATVTVTAASAASPGTIASALVSIGAPPPVVTVSVAPASATLRPLGARQFSATVTNAADSGVAWSVNGIAGGNATVGTISTAGRYSAPGVIPTPPTVTIRATSSASPNRPGSAVVTLAGDIDVGSGKGTANLAAARFLEQAAFGPTPQELAKLKAIGIDAWLEQQFAMAETPIANPGGNSNAPVQQAYMHRLAMAPDQLRQKVAFALGGIFVVSMNKNIYPDEVVPYLRLLSEQAFGNYRTLLGRITISPQMGKYLDLANSRKPTAAGGANENYAREVMQLFTIGIHQLNPDGSERLDAAGQPLPTYDQAALRQVALALTGWTYPGPNDNNWENFSGPMQPRDVNHDTTAKSFLGCSLPAGQGTVQDTDATLDCLFNHPNTAPFVALRLIRALVKSNPSPAYVTRIGSVFANNGAGVRGDLKAVVRAILKDPEARDDRAGTGEATAAQARTGRLKDPLGHVIGFLRALGGSVSPTSGASWALGQMGQAPLAPPSVFGFYSPLFKVPNRNLYGPEFQIYSPTEAVLRNNFLWSLVTNPGSDFTLDISPFVAVAGDVVALIDKVDQALLHGRMPKAMRVVLANALVRQYDNVGRAQLALLLTAVSGQYAVQY